MDISSKEFQLTKARFEAALAKLSPMEAIDVIEYITLAIRTSYDKGLDAGTHIQLKDA